ncbi:DUF397 domain-containing protein [Streptomyces sp. NPDC057099]|uniref:DUF397 domain-containing protein n=1 Tax=Streptomyces sp. NPDC057099 TaxID=3346019 RepID=UPI003628DB7B
MSAHHIPDASALTAWRKSTHSGGDNGDCVEVADARLNASTLTGWRKSTHSGGDNGSCLEVADGHPDLTPVRDSKNPTGPALLFGAAAWSAFVEDVKG